MASLTITVPDATVPRILEAYSSSPEFPASGLTEIQFVQKKLRDQLISVVSQYESLEASRAAEEDVETDFGP